ncbi:glycosyltransferase [Pantoea sp. B65]|uniref:glycosyltransferase n=1 Tax=Pantoea sp. B65 TaxID=2813359 RepID=UPI0039B4041B
MNSYAILIPSYNSNRDVILRTFQGLPLDAHIFVVDDGSKIPFSNVIGTELSQYSNLQVIKLEKNAGIENALNSGLGNIIDNYTYVARLDIGDSCMSERFAAQVNFLERNPDYDLVGCWANFVDMDGNSLFVSKTPVEDNEIRNRMFINNMFIHPSVMMRCAALKKVGLYSTYYEACEDYDLFFRLMSNGKGHNMPYAWLNYEVNDNSISSAKRNKQIKNRIKIIKQNFSFFQYGLYPYYGLIRGVVFLFIGRKTTTFVRKLLGR